AQERVPVSFHGKDAVTGVDEVNHVEQRAHGIDFNAAHHGGLFGVGLRHHHAGNFSSAGFEGDGEGPADSADSAIEREFAYEQAVGNLFLGQATICADDAQRHGQVESRALLLNIGRGKVNGD